MNEARAFEVPINASPGPLPVRQGVNRVENFEQKILERRRHIKQRKENCFVKNPHGPLRKKLDGIFRKLEDAASEFPVKDFLRKVFSRIGEPWRNFVIHAGLYADLGLFEKIAVQASEHFARGLR